MTKRNLSGPMAIFVYHGRRAELLIYAVIPMASYMFSGQDISARFYTGLALFAVILGLNTCRARIGGILAVTYGATIVANIVSFVLLGMLTYIYAAPMIPFLL